MSYRARLESPPAQAPVAHGARWRLRVPRRWSLKAHLVGLVLAVLLPAILVGSTTAWHLAETYRAAYRARLSDTVHALALAVAGEMEALEVAALTFASSPALRRGDLLGFRGWAAEVAGRLDALVVLHEATPGYRQLFNSGVPEGAPLPLPAPQPAAGTGAGELLPRTIASGRPEVSDVFPNRSTGKATVAVAMRVPGADIVVVVGMEASRLSRLVAAHAPAGGGLVAVTDRGGRLVARSRGHERRVGGEAPHLMPPGGAGEAGVFLGRTSDGAQAIRAFRRLRHPAGWTVLVSERLEAFQASWVNPLLGLIAGAVAALGLGVALALLLAERVRRPVSALLRRAEAIAAGSSLTGSRALPPAAVAEFEALRVAVQRADAALREGEAEFRAAFEQAAVPMSQVDCRTGLLLRVNPAYCALLGRTEAEVVGRPFSDFVHPDDRAADLEGFSRMAKGETPMHEAEKRYLRPDGSVRRVHLVSSVVRDTAGLPLRSLAIVQDVTERREAEERQLLLAREVDHRAKNALAVVQGALRLTPRVDVESYAQAVEGRVSALARAHTLLAECRWTGADLRTLAEGELRPFLVGTAGEGGAGTPPRAVIAGPPVRLGPSAAQPVSMVLHELATNAAKYGALSAPGGVVRLAWGWDGQDDALRLRWAPTGGPSIPSAPTRRGFGSRVIEATVRNQLGGRLERRWQVSGLACDIEIPITRPQSGS